MIKHMLRQRVDVLFLLLTVGIFIWGEIKPDVNSEYMLLLAAAYVLNNIINKASIAKGIEEGNIIFKNK